MKTKIISGVIAAISGFVVHWLGGLDELLVALLVLLVIDYIAGVLKAITEKKVSSRIGAKGIAKKVYKLLIVAVAYVIEVATGGALALREIVIMFFIVNEGLSILENAAIIGIPFPKKLKDTLVQLRGTEEERPEGEGEDE